MVLRLHGEVEQSTELPLVHLDRLVIIGRAHLTGGAISALLSQQVPVFLLSSRGVLRGSLIAPGLSGAEARIGQWLAWQAEPLRLAAARSVVRSKLDAMCRVLSGYGANYPELGLGEEIDRIMAFRADAATIERVDALLGVEGSAARAYLDGLARANRSNLEFDGRSRRPPRDPINACLSFGYALLYAEVQSAILASGLDPCVGFYHRSHGNRACLVLDAMEPWRHELVDRLVLRAVNRRELTAEHFVTTEERGTRLTPAGLRRFLALFDQMMRDERSADGCNQGSEEPPIVIPERAVRSNRIRLHEKVAETATWFRRLAIQSGHARSESDGADDSRCEDRNEGEESKAA